MGQVFPIEEESFIEFLQKKLSGQGSSPHLSSLKEGLLEKAKTPAKVDGLGTVKKSRSFLLDLSFKVEKDIKDSTGVIVVKAGTIINPLEKMQLSSGLIFLDGSDEMHLKWARQQIGNFKWIMTNGKPIELEEQEKRPIYFDQGGAYVSRFQIENIPAKVVQKGHLLLVEELALQEHS